MYGVRKEGVGQVAKTHLDVILPAAQSLGSGFASPAESCPVNVCNRSHGCVPTQSRVFYKLVSLWVKVLRNVIETGKSTSCFMAKSWSDPGEQLLQLFLLPFLLPVSLGPSLAQGFMVLRNALLLREVVLVQFKTRRRLEICPIPKWLLKVVTFKNIAFSFFFFYFPHGLDVDKRL